MKKRIFILTLTLFFFASTTGLPIILHYCGMMESASSEVCEMHKKGNIESCCCEKENDGIQYTKGSDSYCSTKLFEPSVKDNFDVSKTEIKNHVTITFVLPDLTSDINNVNNTISNSVSPPLLVKGNNIFLFNSTFLI